MVMIGDILSFARLESGKVEIRPRPISVADAVARAESLVRLRLEEEGLTFRSEAGEGNVLADPDRLQQILLNLLTNAIKFTPPGKHVDLRLDRTDGRLRIRVTDEGEGIDPAFLPYVFERLRQAEGSNKRSGLGLGLAIARHIIELHHGEIMAESDGPGRGARFTVTLPALQRQPHDDTQNVASAHA